MFYIFDQYINNWYYNINYFSSFTTLLAKMNVKDLLLKCVTNIFCLLFNTSPRVKVKQATEKHLFYLVYVQRRH